MKNQLLFIPIGVILLCAAAAGFSQSHSTAPQPGLSLSISAPETSVQTGSDVKVKVTMTNTSSHDLRYGVLLGESHGDMQIDVYGIEVQDEKGNKIEKTSDRDKASTGVPTPGYTGSAIGLVLKPGESITEEVILSKTHDLSQPGEYTIQAKRYDPTSKTFVKSNPVKITATP